MTGGEGMFFFLFTFEFMFKLFIALSVLYFQNIFLFGYVFQLGKAIGQFLARFHVQIQIPADNIEVHLKRDLLCLKNVKTV